MRSLFFMMAFAWNHDPAAQKFREQEAARYEKCLKSADSLDEEIECTNGSVKRCLARKLEPYCGVRGMWKEQEDG